jgi:hypothetical protein
MPERKMVSDTVTVTADGRTIVDMEKLMAKEHIRKMIREIRSKTRVVHRTPGRHEEARLAD